MKYKERRSKVNEQKRKEEQNLWRIKVLGNKSFQPNSGIGNCSEKTSKNSSERIWNSKTAKYCQKNQNRWSRWNQAENKNYLPHFSCHHLRHTFCTRFCENETNLKVIQEIMGHADITTTMDVYNEATKDKKIEVFTGLEGKIKIS